MIKGRLSIILGLLLACLFHPQPAARAETQGLADSEKLELFNEANSFFSRANELARTDPTAAEDFYQKSLLRYVRLAKAGIRNGKLYYNIGNVYFRLDDIGRAILNYRRAQRFMPNDPNLKQNLDYVTSQRQDRIEEKQKEKVLKTLFFWHYDIPAYARAVLFGVSYVLFWSFLTVRLFAARPWTRWGTGVCLLVFLLFLGSLLVDHYTRSTNRPGVIVASEVTARKGDGETYQPSFENPLHAGTDFNLVEERGKWLYIELQDGRRTWVPLKSAEFVEQ